jgi:hypothetical protein
LPKCSQCGRKVQYISRGKTQLCDFCDKKRITGKNEAETMDQAGPFLDTISSDEPTTTPLVAENTFSDFITFLESEDIHTLEVPNFEVLEDEDDILPQELIPNMGLTDRLFTEDDYDELVPSDIAVNDRDYTF